nr:hypothetical protein [Tanacetum cinerariifolium]
MGGGYLYFCFFYRPSSELLGLSPDTRDRDAHVSPPIGKESIVTSASKSLDLPTNVAPTPFFITLEQNKEWVNAMVDGPDAELTDGCHSKSGGIFVQGTSHVFDDVAKVTVVGSERVSSSLTDVVVALSVGEKGDASLPSFADDEDATANPFRV